MLSKPFLLAIPNFDATKPNNISFEVSVGGNQIVANRLIIKKQSDNSVVYNELQENFKYEHLLPANTLLNGEYYNATIIVQDRFANQSPESSPVQFHCYTTPKIEISNIPSNRIINNTNYNFIFNYTQNEDERLNNYIVNLYNSFQTLISKSNYIYTQNGLSPYTGEYLITGLEDKQIYYIEIVGETLGGTIISSGKQQIIVKYTKPNLFTLLSLSNNCKEGSVSVTSNIVLVNGDYYPRPPVYIDNKEIQLTNENDYVQWNQGFSIKDDYLVRIWFRDPNPYTELLLFSNTKGQTISIKYMQGYEDENSQDKKAYMEIYVKTLEGIEYYIFSNYVNILPDDKYYNFQMNKLDNLYQVKLFEI